MKHIKNDVGNFLLKIILNTALKIINQNVAKSSRVIPPPLLTQPSPSGGNPDPFLSFDNRYIKTIKSGTPYPVFADNKN